MVKPLSEAVQMDIVRRYQGGESAQSIARSVGRSQPTIVTLLNRLGVPRHARGQSRRRFTDAEEMDLVARYESGQTASEIASEFKCNKTTVLDALARRGAAVRNGGRPMSELTSDQVSRVVEMWIAG